MLKVLKLNRWRCIKANPSIFFPSWPSSGLNTSVKFHSTETQNIGATAVLVGLQNTEVTEASKAKFLLVSINVHLEGDDSSSCLELFDFLLQQLMLSHIIALVITDV